MTMASERTAYENYMDELAQRIGHVLEGEDAKDAIAACAAIIGYNIVIMDDNPEKQKRLLDWTIRFIRTVMINANAHPDSERP